MPEPSNPFAVNVDAAVAALTLVWGHEYHDFGCHDGRWYAHRKDGAEAITGATPDELHRALHEDWAKRHPSP